MGVITRPINSSALLLMKPFVISITQENVKSKNIPFLKKRKIKCKIKVVTGFILLKLRLK